LKPFDVSGAEVRLLSVPLVMTLEFNRVIDLFIVGGVQFFHRESGRSAFVNAFSGTCSGI